MASRARRKRASENVKFVASLAPTKQPAARPWRRIVALAACVMLTVMTAVMLWPVTPQVVSRRPAQEARVKSAAVAAETEASLARELGLESDLSSSHVALQLDFEKLEQEITAAAEHLVESYADDFQGLHLAGNIYSRYKQTQRAEPVLRQSLSLAPANLQIRGDLAEVLEQLGRSADAAEVLMQATSAAPDFVNHPGYVNLLAESQIGVGNLTDARGLLEAVVLRFPASAENWTSLGKVELQSRDFAVAEIHLRKALEFEPTNELAWLSLVQVLAFQRKTAEAEEAKSQLEALRAASSQQQGDFETQHLPSLQRFAASSFRSLAVIYQNHGASSTAKHWLERSLETDPEDLVTLGHLMSFHRNGGEFETAAEFCRKIIKLEPQVFSNYVNLANLNMEMSRVRTAEAALRLAAKRNLGNGESHLSLAKFLMMLRRPGEAIAPARDAVATLNSIDSRMVLIDALHAAGQLDAAKAEWEEARKLAPNDPRL